MWWLFRTPMVLQRLQTATFLFCFSLVLGRSVLSELREGCVDPKVCDKCLPCYSGERCEKKTVSIKESIILDLNSDNPYDHIFDSSESESCTTVNYDLKFKSSDGSGADAIFKRENGKVQLADLSNPPADISYYVDVVARLSGASQAEAPYATRKDVHVQILRRSQAAEPVLSRQRRAVAAPGNVTFAMRRTFPTYNITHMTYGQRISFEVTISFPNKMTDMSVELFAPDNETEVMMLCNWDIAVGLDVNVDRTNVLNTAIAEGRGTSKWPYTRVVLKLGNVTLKTGSSASADDYNVKITFDSVMIKTSVAIANNSQHWISAGAEFNNETEIWVGTHQVNAVTDADTTTYAPKVDIIGSSTIEPGRTTMYKADMTLPQRFISPMTLDIIAPINNSEIISMCMSFIADAQESYKCIQKDKVSVASKKYPYHQNYYKVSLDFGMVVNKESFNAARPNTSDHILVQFYMRVNKTSTVGTKTYIGIGLQMGTTLIYSGAEVVTVGAATALTNLSASAVTVTYSHSSSGPLAQHELAHTDVTLATPFNSTTDVEVLVTSEIAASIPRFHLCKIIPLRVGRNYPCAKYLIGTNEMPIKYESTQATATYATDRLTLSMPALHNTGLFTTNSTDNELVLRVFYSPSNHTSNVNPNNAKVDFKVTWGGGQNTGSNTISFNNPINVSNLPNSSLPTFTFTSVGQMGADVYQLEGRLVQLKVQVKPKVMYAPATIELVLPYDNGFGATYTVCQALIETIGQALPCLRKGTVNSAVTYTAKSNDTTKPDRAVVLLGPVCSYEDASFTADDYTFTLLFRIYHQNVGTDGTQKWISAGMLVSVTQLWVGQLQLTTRTGTSGDNTKPNAYFKRMDDSSTTIYKLDAARVRLILKIPVGKKPAITVDLTTNSTAGKLSICQLAVVSRGECISCTADNVNYTNFPNDRYNRHKASIPLGKVLNSNCTNGAFYTHSEEDENSLVLEAVVKTTADISGHTSLVADINYGGGTFKVGYHFVVVNSVPPNGTLTKPTYKTSTVNLFDDNITETITNGEATRMYLDIILPPYVKHYIDLNVGNRLGSNIIDIANVNVHSSGKNVPCLIPGYPEANYSRRTGSPHQDFGQIVIGSCLNTFQFESTDENNRIRIEVIARVWKSIATTGSTQVYSLAFLNQDYAQLTDGLLNYTTGLNITTYIQDSSQTINATVNVTDLTIRPGTKFTVPLVVTVPPYVQYQRFLVDYKATDVDGTDSVSVTGSNMTFTYCGQNLAVFCNEPYPVDNTSSRNTSQKDRMLTDLGIFQNTAVTYRLNQVDVANPDVFVVEYELQLTDNLAGYNGSTFWLSFGLSSGNQIILVNKTVTVIRDGEETPVLNFTMNLENSSSEIIYEAGMDIPMYILLSHYNTSSQEPRNCWLNIFHPAFLSLKSVVEPVGYIGPMNNSKISSGNHRFDFPWLFFTDEITINFTMEVVAGAVIPGSRVEAITTVVAELVFDVFNRTGNDNNYKWLRNATQTSFKVRGSPPVVSSCNDNLNIHQTGEVEDCQISAFMSPFTGYGPPHVRTATGWRSFIRGGYYNQHRYVTILFGKLKYVSSIELFSKAGTAKPTELAVYKTMDGRAFTKIDQRAVASWGAGNNASFSLGKKILLRGFRVAVTKSDDDTKAVSMEMAMYGCTHPKTDLHFHPCNTREYDALPLNPAKEHYLRGYLHTGKFLFYCDYVPKKGTEFGIGLRCYKAMDNAATTWTYLGPLVGSVIAYNDHGTAFAVTPDGKSYSMSQDDGENWFVVNEGKYRNDWDKGLMKNATVIPWDTRTGFQPNLKGDKCTAFASPPWNFCYDGIYHNNGSTPVVSWNDCCPN